MLKQKNTVAKAISLAILLIILSKEGSLLWAWHVEAAATTTTASSVLNTMSSIGSFLATMLQYLAFFIFAFLEVLLDPLFIMDIAATEALRNIWIYSRDLMNVLFAFMLIAAGVYTVVTGNKEVVSNKYKKFIIAVILVNFSWFFPRVIFDVANVVTATIYQLPAGLSNGRVECRLPPKNGAVVGEPCIIISDIHFGTCSQVQIDEGYKQKTGFCILETEWQEDTNTGYGILNGLVMNYANLPNLTRVLNPIHGPGVAGTTKGILLQDLMFAMHLAFVLILMLMLFLPLAAMFVVFIVRIPIIWVTVAFMPFMFLGFVMGDQMKQFDSMKIFHKFIAAAFLPAAVAVPFSAGFIVLSQVSQIDCFATVAAGAGLCKPIGPMIHGMHSLWGMLMLFISFFIIWIGFWAAISIDSIYESITAPIKNFGSQVGKTALKIPLSTPIPIGPAGASGKRPTMSLLGIDDKLGSFSRGLSGGRSVTDAWSRSGGGKSESGAKRFRDVFDNPKQKETIAAAVQAAARDNGGTLNRTQLTEHVRRTRRDIYDPILQSAGLPSSLRDGDIADDIIRHGRLDEYLDLDNPETPTP